MKSESGWGTQPQDLINTERAPFPLAIVEGSLAVEVDSDAQGLNWQLSKVHSA